MTAFIIQPMMQRVGLYVFMYPTKALGKKILWTGKDEEGLSFLDRIPQALISKKNESELKITLVNGSILQIQGSDKTEVVGQNIIGIIFSEYALQDDITYKYIMPMLIQNGGWLACITTFRGKNFCWHMFEALKNHEDWYCEILTVNETKTITKEAIQDLIDTGQISEEMAQQEFYCNPTNSIMGAYFARGMKQIEDKGQINENVLYNSDYRVFTAWDLGVGKKDTCSITFFQLIGDSIRVIDFEENHTQSMQFYKDRLDAKGYNYSEHFVPWDAGHKSRFDALTLLQSCEAIGLMLTKVTRTPSVADDIELIRRLLNRCFFSTTNAQELINAMYHHHEEFNKNKMAFTGKVVKDWSEQRCSSFRTLARALHLGMAKDKTKLNLLLPQQAEFNEDW